MSFIVALFIFLAGCLPNAFALTAVKAQMAGRTYPIAEQDMLSEIQQRAKHINITALQKKFKKQLNNYIPKGTVYLPPANKSKSYLVDMSYTLTFDIPRVNKEGKVIGILYPKGFSFNPLAYMPLGKIIPTLIIFNINNKIETNYIKKHYLYKLNTMLLTVKSKFSNIRHFEKQTKMAVFELTRHIADRLHLKNTISVIRRSKKNPLRMRVDVIALTLTGRKK